MKKDQRQKNTARRLFSDRVSAIILSVIVVGMLVTLGALAWRKATTPVDTSDYEGRIVDRWADYTESEQGSRPYFRLLIEANDGKRFTVKVDPNVFESSRVGMRIRSREGQVVLIDSEKNPIAK
jgi:hypothetical protein